MRSDPGAAGGASPPARGATGPDRPRAGATVAAGAVDVDRLTWRPFGRREPVLRDLTVRIGPGERVLLVGPSGSGKSTLLRALAGLLTTADSGEQTGVVTVDGHAPGTRPGEVGLVLQEPGAGVVAASVGRDVAFGLENVGLPRAKMPARVATALEAVGLGQVPLDTPTSALSGGQTQRLALAGALAMEPTLLLLDEPTAMLDPDHAAQVRAAVADVMADGITTVVVEHVLGPWVDLVDRMLVLDDEGRLVADGPVREVLAREHEALLDMGVWVPGEPAPAPVAVPQSLVGARSGGDWPVAGSVVLEADPLVIERSARRADGSARTVVAARLEEALTARPGELTALVGPSGGGKSTVLHTVAGFLTPAAGEVRLTARDPSDLAAPELAERLAWVPQWSSSTIVARTVLDEVLLTSRTLGHDEADATGRARLLLEVLGLDHLERADPRELSGGEQRRLAVAAALLHRPEVLLADEPTVGQDRRTWAALVGLVAAYRRGGGAVVAATHDAEVVARADTVHTLLAPPRPETDPPAARALVARAAPLALLAGAFLAIPAGVLSSHWSITVWVIATQLVLGLAGWLAPGPGVRPRGRLRRLALRSLPMLLAAASAAWSTWLLAGRDLDVAATIALRVVAMVLPSVLLISAIDPDELGDHLGQRLRLPDRPVVATAAALHRVQSFGQIWTEMARARRVRGLDASWRHPAGLVRHLAALSMGLLVRSLLSAADLAVAMDARGFATAQERTWLRPARWGWADTLVVLLAAVPLVVAVLLGR